MISRDHFKLGDNSGRGVLGLVLFALLTLAIATLVGAWMGGFGKGGSLSERIYPPFGGKRVVRILLLGEDNTGLKGKMRGLSDTIILLNIDLNTNRIGALSIPRDTKVDISGYSSDSKINAANRAGGPTLTALAVEGLTGIKPDYYLKTNLDGFKKTVDLLGGVNIYVEKNMHYTDNWGGLHIDLHQGEQLLDGEKAMEYVRFRHDKLGDITRMQRQQKFIMALAKKATAPINLPKLPRVMESVMANMETDLSARDLVFLAQLPKRVDMSTVKAETLPATPERIGGASFMICDSEKTSEIVQSIFFNQFVSGLPKIEVLNGSGITGAALKIANMLKSHGYEVVSVGNASRYDYESSEIVCHKDNIQGLDAITKAMGSGISRRENNPSSKADVTVIIGKDCALASSTE